MATPSAALAFFLLFLPTILAMPNATAPLQTSPCACPSETSLHFYLHQFLGLPNRPNRNEEFVVAPPNPFTPGFGTIIVHGWTLTRTTDPNGTIIARMQGTHIQAGPATGNSWHISSSIVFESGRFAESTLQVMGTLNGIINKWSIVGGTGEFTRATGIIDFKKDPASTTDDTIRELNIRIFHYADVASVQAQ
ncbi:uncharacterized protein LOC123412748 isoform X1 [Hordeum vulgare subsp. vulgare]|uniref:uncharacterized protein LOC123412748 isoform X1 n=1 Tax=Hordeum vulgare subsp. vulgare TaxID=112509 RepID=UPI001D1A39F7|nr:uncharacterized protein LOC123412748 isoform X1 [Hordeum vulgare subsp. vulgare]